MVGGHDLDAAGRPVEELAVLLGGRPQGFPISTTSLRSQ
jgi:hypothetical protein